MEYRRLSEEEYRDRASRILYEDNHLLIVNKYPGDIVQGDKTGDECLTDIYKQNKTYIVAEGSRKDAKLARLNYKFLRSTDRYHLVEVELLTGRHHQIRCQLAGIGCVIKGDLKYGAKRSNQDGSISLHAHEVTFTHPVQKTPVHIIADFVSAENILRE